jgi:tetratricopeptide (TPR) repeat protein
MAMILLPGVAVISQDAEMRKNIINTAGTICQSVQTSVSGLVNKASHKQEASKLGSIAATQASVKAQDGASGNAKSSTAAKAAGISVSLVDKAVELLSSQIDQDPHNPSLHNRLGLIYAEMGELNQAENQFKQAIELARIGLATNRQEVAAKKDQGDLSEASTLMLAASQSELELSAAHSNLARVYEKLGQQSNVVGQLEQLNRDVVIGDGMAQAQSIDAASGKKSNSKASPEIVTGLAKSEALMHVGRFPEAMQLLRRVLSLDPNIAEAHEKLGQAALNSGNTFVAVQELRRACDLDPGSATAHSALGLAYQFRTRSHEAIEEFNKALALNPKDAISAFNLGNIYAHMGQIGDAQRYYRLALKNDPRMAVAHNNLASIYSMQGIYEAAVAEFEESLALAPNMVSAHYGLGVALFNMQDYMAASQEFKKSLALNPNLADAQAKIQVCARKLGQSR